MRRIARGGSAPIPIGMPATLLAPVGCAFRQMRRQTPCSCASLQNKPMPELLELTRLTRLVLSSFVESSDILAPTLAALTGLKTLVLEQNMNGRVTAPVGASARRFPRGQRSPRLPLPSQAAIKSLSLEHLSLEFSQIKTDLSGCPALKTAQIGLTTRKSASLERLVLPGGLQALDVAGLPLGPNLETHLPIWGLSQLTRLELGARPPGVA